ncbi:MAG: hypothetical protein HKN42_16190 [Granulosicoccus sp.]|nr:hypothetical protein [Granulosicoccus sp.]
MQPELVMMAAINAKSTATGGTAMTALILFVLALAPSPGLSQSVDTEAPVIVLEELAQGAADRSQVFTAQVTDDGTLQDVLLYYRREGQLPFTPYPMQATGSNNAYSVSVPTDETDLRSIEYYVQARDSSGNRTVSGFAFDPYRRTLDSGQNTLDQASANAGVGTQTSATDSPLLQRRWVQITLGVLAVGVIAAVAGDDGTETRIVPLTFNVQ